MQHKKLLIVALFLISIMVAIPVSAQPVTFVVPIKQAQFQWRAWASFGAWSYQYQNDVTSIDCKLSGNVIHTYYTYSPVVSDLEGEQTIYVLDKKSELWIEREGTVKYKYPPYYGDHWIVNYWRGYLNFTGTPSATNFVHGVAYQWVYLAASQEDGGILPYAQWDPVMEMWLLGYSIYLWDSDTATQSYIMDFHFVEPVPANIYNPLDL